MTTKFLGKYLLQSLAHAATTSQTSLSGSEPTQRRLACQSDRDSCGNSGYHFLAPVGQGALLTKEGARSRVSKKGQPTPLTIASFRLGVFLGRGQQTTLMADASSPVSDWLQPQGRWLLQPLWRHPLPACVRDSSNQNHLCRALAAHAP